MPAIAIKKSDRILLRKKISFIVEISLSSLWNIYGIVFKGIIPVIPYMYIYIFILWIESAQVAQKEQLLHFRHSIFIFLFHAPFSIL